MSKGHRWSVMVVVALPADELPAGDETMGVRVALDLPSTVSQVMCFDCGQSLSARDRPCPEGERSGYPEQD